MVTGIVRSGRFGWRKVFLSVVWLFMAFCAVAAESGDEIVLKGDLTYETNAGVGLKWTISRPFAIPSGKFLRVTFYYEQDGKRSEVIAALPASDDEYTQILTITGTPEGRPCIYYDIYEKAATSLSRSLVSYISSLNVTGVDKLDMYFRNDAKIPLNRETALAATVSQPGLGSSRWKLIFYQPVMKTLPPITFFVKFSVTDNPNSFVMNRNLDDDLKGMTLEEQLKYIEAERDRRMDMYTRGLAAIGDMNTVQVYLRRITLEIGLREAEKSGNKEDIQKAKDRLAALAEDLKILQ
ncbi:MAG: hypothetical protein AB7F40_02935 [Victivallaceae bacterium]|nr:hypothetical protein [Victivallaceae bacterium]